jgi:RING-box protein 1
MSQSTESNNKPIKLVSWTLYGSWEFKSTDPDCPICKTKLVELCTECLNDTKNKTNCTACRGKCGHCFHYHCITKWISNSSVCPVCKLPFNVDVKDLNYYEDWRRLENPRRTK